MNQFIWFSVELFFNVRFRMVPVPVVIEIDFIVKVGI
jgi:hypothetical protein